MDTMPKTKPVPPPRSYRRTRPRRFPPPIMIDRPTNAVVIRMRPRRPGEKHEALGGTIYSEEVAPGFILDFDEAGHLLEIEISAADQVWPAAVLKVLPDLPVLKVRGRAKPAKLKVVKVKKRRKR